MFLIGAANMETEKQEENDDKNDDDDDDDGVKLGRADEIISYSPLRVVVLTLRTGRMTTVRERSAPATESAEVAWWLIGARREPIGVPRRSYWIIRYTSTTAAASTTTMLISSVASAITACAITCCRRDPLISPPSSLTPRQPYFCFTTPITPSPNPPQPTEIKSLTRNPQQYQPKKNLDALNSPLYSLTPCQPS